MNKKIRNIITITFIMVALLVTFKNPISLKLMDITDFIGVQSGLNVSYIIDALNEIYYL
ncbi:hypothetical protein [uncultured Clostridium sp.]|uniref:hypothetical protein n=1 Tax=uncultured Clostridium sp. TaxID=59620 RepID=UPI002599CB80|nr:hypothetical protein [uncultured Clostridium sp.]